MSIRYTNEQFLQKLNIVNPSIKPIEDYRGLREKIKVTSSCGHIWFAEPRKLFEGTGCPQCNTRKKTNEDFIRELLIKNPTLVSLENYQGNHTKILFKCLTCSNEFKTEPARLLSGGKCPKCSRVKNGIRCRKDNNDFINELKRVNPLLEPLDKYITAKDKIRVRCKSCGLEFLSTPNSLVNAKTGCPNCKGGQSSFFEQVVLECMFALLGPENVVHRNRTAIGMELDIYIPSLRVAIEPGSWFWHANKIDNDREKREKCSTNGIRLITIYDKFPADEICPFEDNIITSECDLGQNPDEMRKVISGLCRELNLDAMMLNWDDVIENAYNNLHVNSTDEFIRKMGTINPNIIVEGNYKGYHVKLPLLCKVCGTKWEAEPSHLINGRGCPKCGKMRTGAARRISHDDFVNRLHSLNSSIIVIGKYVNSGVKIEVKCSNCGNVWSAVPYALLSGNGCPNCARKKTGNRFRKDNDSFVRELLEKNPTVKIIEKYKGADVKILARCKKHNIIWETTPRVLLRGAGCPTCKSEKSKKAHPYKTQDQFIAELHEVNSNIEVLGQYQGFMIKVLVKCKKCQYEWLSTPANLLGSKNRNGRGCPNCVGRVK